MHAYTHPERRSCLNPHSHTQIVDFRSMLEENQCTVEVGRQNAHGKDIFRKVKGLQVGRLQRREQEGNERGRGERRDSVALID